MDKLMLITTCDDGTCCCLTTRCAVALISIMGMVVSLMDLLCCDTSDPCCPMKDCLESMRLVLTWFFAMANMALLTSSVFQNAFLVSLYLWYALGFVMMGLCLAILDLLFRIQHEGANRILSFASEVMFLFVVSRCLPLINTYKKHLDEISLLELTALK